jgi:hypothetical protein
LVSSVKIIVLANNSSTVNIKGNLDNTSLTELETLCKECVYRAGGVESFVLFIIDLNDEFIPVRLGVARLGVEILTIRRT